MDVLVKNPIIIFFRDTISGGWYALYIVICLILALSIIGYMGDRKRRAIEEMLREKKKWAIESGEEARRAAMESKQILDVMEDDVPATPESSSEEVVGDINSLTKEEEVPSVLVIGGDEE